jgi:hypothetical protein
MAKHIMIFHHSNCVINILTRWYSSIKTYVYFGVLTKKQKPAIIYLAGFYHNTDFGGGYFSLYPAVVIFS